MKQKVTWTAWHSLALVALGTALLVVGVAATRAGRQQAWLLSGLLMALMMGVAGHGTTRRWLGALIDRRNRMSLSRLQMALWTLIVASSLYTAALANVANGVSAPLSIAIPAEIWLLMGISTATLVGSPLVLASKRTSELAPLDEAHRLNRLADLGMDVGHVETARGALANTSPRGASLGDLVWGEEVGNAGTLDLARTQMLLLTLVLASVYAASLGARLAGSDAIHAFPSVDAGMLALLGISHTGYLTSKAIPHGASLDLQAQDAPKNSASNK